MTNVLRTTVLLAALTALFLVIGGAIGGNQGLFIAFVFALVMNFASYWFSDKIVLADVWGREPSACKRLPELHRLVQRLAQRAGIPMPRVYIIPSDAPNAFATGVTLSMAPGCHGRLCCVCWTTTSWPGC